MVTAPSLLEIYWRKKPGLTLQMCKQQTERPGLLICSAVTDNLLVGAELGLAHCNPTNLLIS